MGRVSSIALLSRSAFMAGGILFKKEKTALIMPPDGQD
jgi:hypothetical protein